MPSSSERRLGREASVHRHATHDFEGGSGCGASRRLSFPVVVRRRSAPSGLRLCERNRIPVELRGAAFGAIALATGIVLFPANLIVGLLWENINYQLSIDKFWSFHREHKLFLLF
ncbi:MAG: hypothetical protein AAF383_20645 [Cyanobacteria bacterium P01_A01_bin.83]